MTDPSSSASLEVLFAGKLAELQPSVFGSLAEEVDDALLGSKTHLAAVAETVRQVFRNAWAEAPQELREALRTGRNGDPVVNAAYNLGQLGLAQHLLDGALNRRADDDFVDVANGERHRALTQALAAGEDLTVGALVSSASLHETEVRIRLGELVLKGVVDFVRAPELSYFLTPAGKAVVSITEAPACPQQSV